MSRFKLKATTSLLGLALALVWSAHAHAHIRMDSPVARNVWAAGPGGDPIKDGPCGSGANDPRTTDPEKINVFAPGETISVTWHETINHPGHFRISFDKDGQDDFKDKTSPTDIVDPPVLPVLLDGIADAAGGPGSYSVDITLPNEPCDNCTLQLIQYMTDSNDSYYVCADIVIEGEVSVGDGDDTGSASTGDSAGDTGATDPETGGTGTGVGSGGAAASGGAGDGSGALPLGSGGDAALGSGGALSSGGTSGPMDPGTTTTTADSDEEEAGCSLHGSPNKSGSGGSSALLLLVSLLALARTLVLKKRTAR